MRIALAFQRWLLALEGLGGAGGRPRHRTLTAGTARISPTAVSHTRSDLAPSLSNC